MLLRVKDIRNSSVAPDVTSMKLSTPKPTEEMLPAIAPATTAIRPSSTFQAIVKYSSLRPRRAIAVRSKTSNSAMTLEYYGVLTEVTASELSKVGVEANR